MDKQGEKIRLLRIANKILEKDMATRLFMSPSAYSNLERNISKMYLERFEQIAAIFGMTAAQLLAFDERYLIHLSGNNGGNSDIK